MDKQILYRYFNGQATPDEVHEVRLWASASDENAEALRRERQLFNMMLVGADNASSAHGNAFSANDNAPSAHGYGALRRGPSLAGTPWQGAGTRPQGAGSPLQGRAGVSARHGRFAKLGRTASARVLRPLAAAASIAAAVLVTWLVCSPHGSGANVARQQWLQVSHGQQAQLLLADSSRVWVNAGSRIAYPTAFSPDRREVQVQGEAFFDVRHDDETPFIVHAGDMEISVLGTKFNVVTDSAARHFEASLIEGRLRVEVLKPHGRKPYYLTTGHRLSVDDGRVTLSRVNDPERYRWREGLYCITSKPLADICADLQKYYGERVNISDKALARRTLSGKFRFADGIDYNMSVMAAELHFTYTHDYARRVITIR